MAGTPPHTPITEVVVTMLMGSGLACGAAGIVCLLAGRSNPAILLVVAAVILLGDGLYFAVKTDRSVAVGNPR